MQKETIHNDRNASLPSDSADQEHYLKNELYRLVREEPLIFDFLQDGSLDGIWYWDLEHPDHEWMSPRFWEVFGYSPEEKPHLAEAWQDMIDQDDLQVALDNFHKHCADPLHPYDQVVRYQHKNGHTVWVRCRGLAVRDETGKPIRMLGAHSEVTALKEAEATLQRQSEELERSNAELAQFAYVASHDLQEPLRKIIAFSDRLRSKYGDGLDDTALDYMDRMQNAASRMQTLINDLLTLSRVTTNGQPFQQVDLSSLIPQVISDLETAIEESGGQVELGGLPSLKADPLQMRQLFQNLISNALKFHRADAAPIVKVYSDGHAKLGQYQIIVEDNGIGFDEKYLDRIFQPFQRLHSRRHYEGTGMGLATCRKIVERHRGTLSAQSHPGNGATFVVTLPISQEA